MKPPKAHLDPVCLAGKAHGQLHERGERKVMALRGDAAPVQDALQQANHIALAYTQRLFSLQQLAPARQKLAILTCITFSMLLHAMIAMSCPSKACPCSPTAFIFTCTVSIVTFFQVVPGCLVQ